VIRDVLPQQMAPGKGRASTFILRILYRQHSSWQGTIRWCEGKQEMCFRSALELLILMDSALQDAKNALYICAEGKND